MQGSAILTQPPPPGVDTCAHGGNDDAQGDAGDELGFGASIVEQLITQYTNEPIEVSVAANVTSVQHARTYVDDYVAVSSSSGSNCSTSNCVEMPADPE